MKKIILLIIFYSLLSTIKAQNLVPNWSFEDTTQCPNSGGQINFAAPWYNPNTASPDYFNQCGTIGFQFLNVWGYQIARTGQAYAQTGVFGSTTSSMFHFLVVVYLVVIIKLSNITLIHNKKNK